MTELLQELARELAKLPAEKQAEWVSRFLDELTVTRDEHNGNGHGTEEGDWIGGRKPTREEISLAIQRIEELSKDNILGDDLTIKDLINEGRRY